MRFRQRTTDWVTHTFREHNKEADLWARKGAKGRAEEWVDIRRFLIASRMMKYFMQASYNITGQKNGANI